MLIDAHHHLWDIEQHHYPWLAAYGQKRFFGQPDAIRKNYLIADFCQDHKAKVDKSVHIQVGIAEHLRLDETKWLQQCHEHSGGKYPCKAVVEIDMLSANIEQQILAHKQFSITQGVRHIIGKSPDENKTLPKFDASKWLSALNLLEQHQLSFDLQLTEEQYQDVYQVLQQLPNLKVAICHLASPWDQSEHGFNQWIIAMQRFASLPNCYMKISGFSMFNHGFDADNFSRYAQQAITLFGSDRCMLGSNFPVDKLYMSYESLMQHWQHLLVNYTAKQQSDLRYKTAASFYDIMD
ncbi:amidohydrolase [Colwelliaceae bacterium BS250]